MTDILYVNIDGASRGNPGMSACGVIIRNDREIIHSHGIRLGFRTNNQAEYEGLTSALNLLTTIKFGKAIIRSDSLLLVNQMKGDYRVKNEGLKPYHRLARGLVCHLAATNRAVEFVHIPRDQNKDADDMANKALDMDPGKFDIRVVD